MTRSGTRSGRVPEDAAKAHGITLQYSYNQNGPEQATLVQNAIDSKVSGLAVTLSNADAVIPVTKKAAAAGIPVVAFNQGIADYKEAGAKMYFGLDETAGRQDHRPEAPRPGRPGRQDAVRDPGAGLRGAAGPLRRA